MTRDEMDTQLQRMVILKNMPGDSEEYWRVFQSMPIGFFKVGVNRAIATRTWFPTPAELHDDCARPTRPAAFESPAQVPVGEGEPRTIRNPNTGKDITVTEYRDWKYYCEDCSDLGQRSFWCGRGVAPPHPWQTLRTCDRRSCPYPHEYVAACACVDTNPAILRRKARAEEAYRAQAASGPRR